MGVLDGKTALVTGASRGIGEACARALDGAGARVAIAARSEDGLHALAKELANDPFVLPCDLSADNAASGLADDAVAALGRVDILVNNAGASLMRPAAFADEKSIADLFQLNQVSVLMLASKLGAHMAQNGGGAIVNMSSVAAKVGVTAQAAYAATKGALDSLTRSLAAELGPKGVRVNAVRPGVIHTDMWDAGLKMPGVREHIEANTALRRVGTADDIAQAVLFLASPAASFITGQTLDVDGGATDTFVLIPASLTGG